MEFVFFYLIVNAAVGIAACFFGKRLFYLMLGLLVFLGVFDVALASGSDSPVMLVVAAVLGVLAAVLSKYVYRAGVFLIGFAAGATLGFLAAMLLPSDATAFLWVIVVVAGLLVGLAAARWSDLAVRLGTAWTGAAYATPNLLSAVLAFPELSSLAVPGDAAATYDALSTYIAGDFVSVYGPAVLVGTIALAVAGAVVQARHKG